MEYLWIVISIFAALMQAVRTAAQRTLNQRMSNLGTTYVRSVFGMPLMVLFLVYILVSFGGGWPKMKADYLILTAVRSFPLRHIHEDQIEDDVWTIPADNMKGRLGATSDFRVPLSREAQAVIGEARKFARDGYLFPGTRKGVISDMTMSNYLKRLGLEARPHGYRSSFRDWCAEATDTPREIAESALGHVTGSSAERAYRRTDYLEQRLALMRWWAKVISSPIHTPADLSDSQ